MDYYKDGDFGLSEDTLSDKQAASLVYKMSYYRFGEIRTLSSEPTGWDRARDVEIGQKDIKFELFEEAYTTKLWIVRLFRVLPKKNRARKYEEEIDRRLWI